jgi:TrpR-related protein YerC/YecD
MLQELNTKSMKDLFKAISSLESSAEAKKFMRDLCTLSELQSMSERLQVVQELEKGVSYREINKKTGVSTATITRVAHWLHHGMGGYQLMLKRLS